MKRFNSYILFLFAITLIGCKEKNASQSQNVTESDVKIEENLPKVISENGNDASCVYLTKDQSGVPYISWVEIDSTKQKHFFFAKFDEETMEFEDKQN